MSQEQVHARCAIQGCLQQPYSCEDISLPVCVEHSDGTICIEAACTNLREAERDYCAIHPRKQERKPEQCLELQCRADAIEGQDYCLEHCPTPVHSEAEEPEPEPAPAADVEEQVIVTRKQRDASPVRPTKFPREPKTPLKSHSVPRCPNAPRKGPPPPRTTRVAAYHPGDRLLLPTQRLNHKCRCGNDLHYEEADTYAAYTQKWTCKGHCGFMTLSNMPKGVYRLTPLNWQAWFPFEHSLYQLNQ